jgi:8-oxo-dGTP pyrophosphatase MutT (NUDIX family)
MEKHGKVQVVTIFHDDASYSLLLLQTKKDRGEYWQNVTGSVDPGESWEAAAARELLEETGLQAQQVHPTDLEFFFHDRWERNVHEKVFYAIVNSNKVTISQEEHQNFQWKMLEDVTEADFGHINNFNSFLEVKKLLC